MSVGVTTFDTHHQKLIEEINKFYAQLGNKNNWEILTSTLYQLKNYSIYHFSAEETMMRRFGFPGYANHKIEHGLFLLKVEDLQKKMDEGKMVLTVELAGFLKGWLANHIQKTDKEYTSFLNQCGIK